MSTGNRRFRFWVFVRGRTAQSARGAEIEIVEARKRARADRGEGSGGYWWAEFPDMRPGTYTVRVRFPSGVTRERQVTAAADHDQARFDEDESGPS